MLMKEIFHVYAITTWVSSLTSFKSPLAPLFQSGESTASHQITSYVFHNHVHSPLCLAEVLAPFG